MCKVLNITLTSIIWRDGIIQKYEGIIINVNKVLVQLRERFIILVEGSKVMKRFAIICFINGDSFIRRKI